ncbi:DegV family protein [Companilactobacillus sp.]|jgi:DegV family protein with EDD domain|uniref:DegV family protein n=1 Tax=Companilactobacillus sp. TaxID=2767905 RepID=UPI0025C4E84E|nr:DegV family protein [Companilactobacillus sp.]MCH4009862.1 DegV family protein [Companilactobacillus sp.]MCH4052462.1 DegV family protein [Companilactobacillus sp.]MCH4077804.1 DegV family protein [Companilactobacillus sp.]MCH4126380.1 DegV family protein [Companilactobacillus sp.]MCI1312702.1 DegV family protein [Companilactobacillus sp.]
MTEKIAVFVDSCCDIPQEYVQKDGIFELPMQIIYKDENYLDRVNISSEQVYDSLDREIPKTSLPSGDSIERSLDEAYANGYRKIISISISSNLSGTFNFLKTFLENDGRFEYKAFDTKQVAVGAGLIAVVAKDLVDEGKSFEEVVDGVQKACDHTVTYFCIPTLTYLRAGGRIGLVSSVVGGVLKLAPIITCNEEGIYTAIAKARGMKRGQKIMREKIKDFVGSHQKYLLAVSHGNDEAAGGKMLASLEENGLHGQKEFFGIVGPALGVHTGPGLVGVACTLLD